MERTKTLTLDPEASGKNTVRFHRHMAEGEIIADATAKIQVRTSTDPVRYADAEGMNTTAAVVDAHTDQGVLIREKQAVQCQAVDSDGNPLTPEPGTGYRWLVTATITGRDVPLVAKNPLTIRP